MQTPPTPPDDGPPPSAPAEPAAPPLQPPTHAPDGSTTAWPTDNGLPPANLLAPGAAEPSDNSPTVISRTTPRPSPPNGDLLDGGLRGKRLAHFELIEPIGVGGMAAVLRARDTQLDRQVALKILPPEMAADPENVRRFHQEARSAARLDHENIARVFFCGEDQRLHFIAFEFVEGQNLRTLLERRGRLPVREALHYVLQVATGLAHAAARGVVHRDIKPSNIIITPSGRAKLVDMGLARSLERHTDHDLTQSGVTLGTFDYISPEQALEPRDADVRSDIYSLGCTFYHMLTGQPPVPEGTAARKLHHHQHVPPLDPRQLNPDIPDEVAAVLSRMMAKDPRDRYQRAEHLVQHLLLAAQKLGAAPEVPDGVLFVDAPLPQPPRPRPVLVAVAAVAVLVVLVLLLGQASRLSGPSRELPAWTGPAGPGPQADNTTPPPRDRNGKDDGAAPKDAPPSGRPVPRVQTFTLTQDTLAELGEFVATNTDSDIDLVVDGDIRLPLRPYSPEAPSNPAPGLFVKGRKVTVRGKDATKRPTITLTYDLLRPVPADTPLWAALTVEGDDVTVKDLRFVIDNRQSSARLAALELRSGGTSRASFGVEGCEFRQEGGRPGLDDGGRPCAVAVSRPQPPGREANLSLTGCSFLAFLSPPGETEDAEPKQLLKVVSQDAVALASPAKVRATQCAFGPHAALFRFEAEGTCELRHCSALLAGESAAFHLANAASCGLVLAHCVFSRPEGGADPSPKASAVLIRQAGGFVKQLTDRDNRYHNLSAFWVRGGEVVAGDLAGFRDWLAQEGLGASENSQLLASSPWKDADPLRALEQRQPQRAFALKTDARELRTAEDRASLVGLLAQPNPWEPDKQLYGPLPPLGPPPPVARKEKVVDPRAETGKGIYRTLQQALDDIKPEARGEVILLRWDGRKPVQPVELKGSLSVTLRPDKGYQPVLELPADTLEKNAYLFRVHNGELRLEELEFRLEPANDKFQSQAVVEVAGDGACHFQRCVVTLDGAGRSPRLAAAAVHSPDGLMKMGAPGAAPRLSFDGCFVRGQGDLAVVRAGRPCELKVEKSLAALAGSLLHVQSGKDAPAPGAEAGVRLDSSTAYLNDYLVWLDAGDKDAGENLKGLVPVKVRSAANCLFVAAQGKALVHLDGPEANEAKLKELFSWKGEHNAYSNFEQMLDQEPPPGMMAGKSYTQKEWENFTGEKDGLFKRVSFPSRPSASASALPSHFKVKAEADVPGYGVPDLDALPRPAKEK